MKLVYRIAGALALAGISASASAQHPGWIAGVAFGQSSLQDYDIGTQLTTSDDSDDSDDSMRIFGGYMLSPMQGVVVSWIDLGMARFEGTGSGGAFFNCHDAEGYDISYIVGWAPGSQTRFSVFGTVGVFAWDQDFLYLDPTGALPFQDEGASFSMGVGGEFKLTEEIGIHLEYQLFKDVGDDGFGGSGVQFDRDVVSLGVVVRFGKPRE